MINCCDYCTFYRDYKIISLVYKSSLSSIYTCKCKSNISTFKTIVKIQKYKYGNVEAKILKFLNKKKCIFVPIYVEHYVYKKISYLVMEEIQGNTLKNFLHINKKLSYMHRNTIANLLIEYIKVLHLFGIIHRDLKSDNILIYKSSNNNINVKIIDYGFSVKKKYTSIYNFNLTYQCGTYNYMPPEILTKKYYNVSCDSYSLGIILYYLFTNTYPYDISNINIKNNHLYNLNILKKKNSNINYNIIKRSYWNKIIKNLLNIDKYKRLIIT